MSSTLVPEAETTQESPGIGESLRNYWAISDRCRPSPV